MRSYTKQDFLNSIPTWYEDLIIRGDEAYYLVITDDMDALLSAHFLIDLANKNGKFLKIEGYFDFGSGLYLTDEVKNDHIKGKKQPIFIDCSVLAHDYKCFDNHVFPTLISNPNEIDANKVLKDVDEFKDHFCGSTLLMLYSLYNIDISKLQHHIKMDLLVCDWFVKGFFNEKYKHINIGWLETLELTDLISVLENHSLCDFIDYRATSGLGGKITIQDGKLIGSSKLANLILPEDNFTQVLKVSRAEYSKEEFNNLKLSELKKVYTIAQNRADLIRASIIDD